MEPDYLNTTFYMEQELFFCDLNNMGGPENWLVNIKDFDEKAVFKSASLQTFTINKLA